MVTTDKWDLIKTKINAQQRKQSTECKYGLQNGRGYCYTLNRRLIARYKELQNKYKEIKKPKQ